jgi:mRNA interferase MazF
MGVYAAGQVVFLTFPFSDLSRSKLRPVLLLADAGQTDWIACQITSNPYIDDLAIPLAQIDFVSGGLKHLSYIRPGKLFTASESLFAADAGLIDAAALRRVRDAVVALIQGPSISFRRPLWRNPLPNDLCQLLILRFRIPQDAS